MKRSKLVKVIAGSLVGVLVFASNSIGASAEWRQDSNGWWNVEGNTYSIGWKEIDGEWYYFDNTGYMKTGWILDNGKWYYLSNSGAMAKNTTIDGFKLDLSGAWIQSNKDNSSKSDDSGKKEDGTLISDDYEQEAERFIENHHYEITKRLGVVSKITLDKSMFEDGKSDSELNKKIWAVQDIGKELYYGKEITTYEFTVKNHPLEKKYNVDTSLYIMFCEGALMGSYSIPNNGSRNEIYSGCGETAEEVSNEICDAKPVIYLYPKQKTDVKVNLDFNGKITCLYPKYDKDNTWNVTAYPDGKIINKSDNREYSYLYWEGMSYNNFDLSKGFVVKGEDTAEFLHEKLEYMGLTARESDDFITYWLPKMDQNKYNLISFQKEKYTDSAKLNISPSPDSILRVFMAFKPLDKPVEVEKQNLDTFNRQGFTVVEWGGAEIK